MFIHYFSPSLTQQNKQILRFFLGIAHSSERVLACFLLHYTPIDSRSLKLTQLNLRTLLQPTVPSCARLSHS